MATTYSTSLKLALIGDGDQSGIWGQTTNTNLGTAIEEAITGSADVTFTNGNDTTVTLTDTNATQAARNLRLNLIGSATGAQNLILGSGCRTHECPAHRHWSIYAGAVLPSRWLRNLTHRFTNYTGLDRDAVYDHLVDQSNCLSYKTKPRD